MKLDPRFAALLSLGLSDAAPNIIATSSRCFTLRKEVIEHPTFTEAIREIARRHERGRTAGVAEGLLLVAQTGSGKTTALEYYLSRFPRTETSAGSQIPVVLVNTPESPTVKSLAQAILYALEDPAADKGTATTKTNRIIYLFKACRVELLLVDEFQHFIDGHMRAESRRVSDWLKNLINKVNVPVVLSGLPRAIAVVFANPQLRRRFGSPYYMKPFSFTTQEEQKEFRGVMLQLQQSLPVDSVDLSEANLARSFYFASHGLFDYVIKIVDDAVSRGGSGPRGALVHQDYAKAFRRTIWADAPDVLNPFMPDATLRLLNMPLEPFDVWDDISTYTLGSSNPPRRLKPNLLANS